MVSPFLKAMQPKKKRPVDPNAPPRPNLLSHEKVLKDNKATMQQMQDELFSLRGKVQSLERKLSHQSNYLTTLHQQLSYSKRRSS
jgi:TolA-binding protein